MSLSGLLVGLRPPSLAGRAGLAPGPRRFGCLAPAGRSQRLPRTLRAAAVDDGEPEEQAVVLCKEPGEPPYLEPFVRSLLLGLGSAVVLESIHELLQLASLASSAVDVQQALEALPPPLFVADHVTAIAGWLGFYVIEAVAIAAVLRNYAEDAAAAMPAIRQLVTLPKKMLPLRLQLFKQLLLLGRDGGFAAAAAIATGSFVDAPPAPTVPLAPAAPKSPSLPASSAFVTGSAGTAVLPTPQYPPTLPLPPKERRTGLPDLDAPSGTPQERPASSRKGSNILPVPPASEGSLTDRRSRQNLRPGEWDPASSSFARRQKELQDRTSYLTNFWYCAAIADSVKAGKPHGVQMFGKQFVLFRGEDGTVSCLDDTCPHRGAPLSAGWMSKAGGHDCVVCPYHGWAVDGTGHLQDVPAAESREEWPRRQIVPTYPVIEKGGFIWLFYGSKDLPPEERPPIPYVPELDDPNWKPVYGEIEFDVGHHGVFENALDMAHIHYLHNDTFGNQDQPKIMGMTTEQGVWSVTAKFALHNKPVSALWEWSKVPEVHVTATAYLPSTSVISFTLAHGLSFTTFVNTVPISANKSVNRFALIRNLEGPASGAFNADAWDSWARKAMLRILGEDKVMVERLRPDLLPIEYSVRADLPQIAFRKLRQQWVDLGWAEPNEVDAEKIRERQARFGGHAPDF